VETEGWEGGILGVERAGGGKVLWMFSRLRMMHVIKRDVLGDRARLPSDSVL
jgi:hypothetical protein